MACRHWDSESNFCVMEKKTVNPDELAECAEECQNFSPPPRVVMLTCKSCGNKYPFSRKRAIEVGTKEYAKCTFCGDVNLRTDDEVLSRGSE